MVRTFLCFALGLWSATVAAQPHKGAPSYSMPKVGDTLGLFGFPDWPAQTWLYEAPAQNDAAGKVVVHWFCTPKVSTCQDDLARIITLRDVGHVYIIAYINGSEGQAKKLDPIRESEGVGRGTAAYGKGVAQLVKGLGIGTGPASIVVDVDGKVKAVTTSGDINELDARDKLVNSLVGQIKEYSSSTEGPTKPLKPGEKLQLTFKVQLASWLSYSKKTSMSFTLTAPKALKCDGGTTLKDDQLKIVDKTLTATLNCSAPHGNYEVQGRIHFGYEAPGGGEGLGDDGATWKFEVK